MTQVGPLYRDLRTPAVQFAGARGGYGDSMDKLGGSYIYVCIIHTSIYIYIHIYIYIYIYRGI